MTLAPNLTLGAMAQDFEKMQEALLKILSDQVAMGEYILTLQEIVHELMGGKHGSRVTVYLPPPCLN